MGILGSCEACVRMLFTVVFSNSAATFGEASHFRLNIDHNTQHLQLWYLNSFISAFNVKVSYIICYMAQ